MIYTMILKNRIIRTAFETYDSGFLYHTSNFLMFAKLDKHHLGRLHKKKHNIDVTKLFTSVTKQSSWQLIYWVGGLWRDSQN